MQLSVFLENRVGALLSVVQQINAEAVEVLGLSVVDSVDVTVVRFIVTDPDRVIPLFVEKGIPFSETRMAVVELDEGAHGLTECFKALLTGETNIHFSYPLLSHPNGKAAISLCLEDVDFGLNILHQSGFKVLCQDDLSR